MSGQRRLLRAALLTAGPVLLFGPMLVQGEALYWGTPALQFIPWRDLGYDLITAGHLPLWNPYLGMGAPLLANYQSALLYPPNFLLALVGPAWGDGLLVALHLIWAAWGVALLMERLGLGELPQIVGGLAFSLSGYMVARAGFLTINAAAAWLPWVILAVDGLIAASRREPWSSMVRPTAILGSAFAMQWLAGHAQTAWYSLVLVVVWSVWRVLEHREHTRPLRAFAGLGVAGALGFCLAAIQLIPTLEYLAASQRSSAVGRDFALTYSFWPWRLTGLLAPNLFGNPATGDYWGYGNFWEDAIYIGVLPLVTAVAGVIRQMRSGGRSASLVRLLMIVVVTSCVLALGKNTPVFPFLFDHVPTFDLFQAPTRWNLLLVFSLALLAAIGVEGWSRPKGRGLYWSRLGTVGAGVVMLTSPLGLYLLQGVEPTFVRGLAWAGGLLCLTGILTLSHPRTRSLRWISLAGGFVMLDLVMAGAGLNPALDASVFMSRRDPADVQSGHRWYMTAEAEYTLKFDEAFPFSSFRPKISMDEVLSLGVPNTLILRGLHSANNFDPILPARYTTFINRLDGLAPDQRERWLRLMDVASLTDLDQDKRLRRMSVEGAQRVRVIPEAIWVPSSDEALARVLEPGFQPDEVVVLEGAARSKSDDATAEATTAVVAGANPNEIEIRLSAGGPVWLVLSDMWYPGWRAFVDDRQVEVYHADYLFRAVHAPAGDHLIRFVYSPTSFWVGLGLSAAAWTALAGAMWRRTRI